MDVTDVEQVAIVLRRVGIAAAGDWSLDRGIRLVLREIIDDVLTHSRTPVHRIAERTALPAGFVTSAVVELWDCGLLELHDVGDDHVAVILDTQWRRHIHRCASDGVADVLLGRLLADASQLFIERFGATLEMLGALLLPVPDFIGD